MTSFIDEWMSEREAAAEIRVTVRTLRDWRKRRTGPPYTFFGRTIRYHRQAFFDHFRASQVMPTRKLRRA